MTTAIIKRATIDEVGNHEQEGLHFDGDRRPLSQAGSLGTRLDERELGTVLAALRLWQRLGGDQAPDEMDVATNGGRLRPMEPEEVDLLCERLNG